MNGTMYKFTSLYNVLSKVSLAVGSCFPGISQLPSKFYPLLVLNCVVSTVTHFFTIICNSIFYYKLGPYDIKRHGLTAVSIVILFDTFYYLFRREEFQSLLRNFDDITENLINSIFVSCSSVQFILSRAQKFNSYTKYYTIVIPVQSLLPTIISFVLHYVYQQNFLFLEVPYSIKSEYVFLITNIVLLLGGLYTLLKMVYTWTVMFLLLYHITFYLKTLSDSLHNFNLADKKLQNHNVNIISKTVSEYRFRSWIQLHQKILRWISQFNKLYSPLLLVHFLNFYASGLCYVFAITVQKERLIFSLPMMCYVTIQMMVFLALFTIGNELSYQSSKIFQNGYVIIHLSADKALSSCGLIIGEVANRPVIVSAFGSEYFNLSLDAFLLMVKSMASLYVGLTQFEKLNKNYNNI